MAYVYRHIRLDKNIPFYIGIGERKGRSLDTSNRNKIWRSIADKTEYEVEILFDNIDFDSAREKEIEFIKLYGRIDTGTGTLANLTNGGDGSLKHNYCKSKLYQRWGNIKKSCYNKNHISFKYVGERGISICEEWLNYENFRNWCLRNGWSDDKKLFIIRIDKKNNFSPTNCFISDKFKDAFEKISRAKVFEYRGEMLSIPQLSKKYKIPYTLLRQRLHDKWSVDEAIFTPLISNMRNKKTKNKNNYNGHLIC